VQLAEARAVRALRRRLVHEAVLDELDHAARAQVLEPRQAEVVRRQRRDHVVVAVAVDVVREHLRAALAVAELHRVEAPLRIAR